MNDEQKLFSELELICQKQKREIEKLRLQLWDIEEENRVLQRKIENQQKEIEVKEYRICELETWCTHLQSIIDKDIWIICKRIIVKFGKKILKLLKL